MGSFCSLEDRYAQKREGQWEKYFIECQKAWNSGNSGNSVEPVSESDGNCVVTPLELSTIDEKKQLPQLPPSSNVVPTKINNSKDGVPIVPKKEEKDNKNIISELTKRQKFEVLKRVISELCAKNPQSPGARSGDIELLASVSGVPFKEVPVLLAELRSSAEVVEHPVGYWRVL